MMRSPGLKVGVIDPLSTVSGTAPIIRGIMKATTKRDTQVSVNPKIKPLKRLLTKEVSLDKYLFLFSSDACFFIGEVTMDPKSYDSSVACSHTLELTVM